MQSILHSRLDRARFAERPVPSGAGTGLKSGHVRQIIEERPQIGFFEIHAENYMGAGGLPHAELGAIRELYPISVHGVAMSIGGERDIDAEHLARFAAVIECYRPGLVSEHLAWSTHDGVFYNDLLPLPYTGQTLRRVVEHVDRVQAAIKRPILIENPSTYVLFSQSDWSETEFLDELAARSGCGLLLDVNNVFVSATNHGWSPEEYLAGFPLHRVGEIHLAGHSSDVDDHGATLLIDAHDRAVADPVWELYRTVLARTGPLPSLVEWDNDVPQWPVLEREAARAQRLLDASSVRIQAAE